MLNTIPQRNSITLPFLLGRKDRWTTSLTSRWGSVTLTLDLLLVEDQCRGSIISRSNLWEISLVLPPRATNRGKISAGSFHHISSYSFPGACAYNFSFLVDSFAGNCWDGHCPRSDRPNNWGASFRRSWADQSRSGREKREPSQLFGHPAYGGLPARRFGLDSREG